MGLFTPYSREGHGISKEQANAPAFIQFFRIYTTRFWTLILANLIYMAFMVFTLFILSGPATAGLTKITRNWSRRDHAFVWGDFWETYKKNFGQATVVGLINLLVWFILIFDFLVGSYLVKGLAAVTAALWLFMSYYIYTMLITFKLTLKQLYKNALIFACVGIFRNIGITIIIGLISMIFFFYWHNPLFWILFICCYGGTCNYVSTFITYPLIKKHMIDGVDPKTGKRIEQQPEDDE